MSLSLAEMRELLGAEADGANRQRRWPRASPTLIGPVPARRRSQHPLRLQHVENWSLRRLSESLKLRGRKSRPSALNTTNVM